jgi:hypothetical protein
MAGFPLQHEMVQFNYTNKMWNMQEFSYSNTVSPQGIKFKMNKTYEK